MAWRKIRRQHKLLFRYDPDENLIEIRVRGRIEVIRLDEYRSAQLRQTHPVRVDVHTATMEQGLDDDTESC
jgi:hypothetical protein